VIVYHFIPTAEEEVHKVGTDCQCEPELIDSFKLEGSDLEGEICYHHQQFGPDEIQVLLPSGETLYTVLEEGERVSA
jgi:hypothetical protein